MTSGTLQGTYPQQIAGGNTHPVTIRNLSVSATIYVGYSTSVSPSSADMVIRPGELFSSPANNTVYVCTDEGQTASFIYNTSGTGVQLSGPTSVSIDGDIALAPGSSVGINGTPNVNATVGGSVAVTNPQSTVTVANPQTSVSVSNPVTNPTVSGTVTANPGVRTLTLADHVTCAMAATVTYTPVSNADVSSYKSLFVFIDVETTPVDGGSFFDLRVIQMDAAGNVLDKATPIYIGRGFFKIPLVAPRVTVTIGSFIGMLVSRTITVIASSADVLREYYHQPGDTGQNVGFQTAGAFGSYQQAKYYDTQAQLAASTNGTMYLPSYSGPAQLAYRSNMGTGATQSIHSLRTVPQGVAAPLTRESRTTTNPGTSLQVILPEMPVALLSENAAGGLLNNFCSISFE